MPKNVFYCLHKCSHFSYIMHIERWQQPMSTHEFDLIVVLMYSFAYSIVISPHLDDAK